MQGPAFDQRRYGKDVPDAVLGVEQELRHGHRIDGDDLAPAGNREVHPPAGLLRRLDLAVEHPKGLPRPRLAVQVLQRPPAFIAQTDRAQANARVDAGKLLAQTRHRAPRRRALQAGVQHHHLAHVLALFEQEVQGDRHQLRLGAQRGHEDRRRAHRSTSFGTARRACPIPTVV